MRKATLTLVALLSILGLSTPRPQAQTFTVLHYFDGTDGANPVAGLIMDKAGNLYGTTVNGGGSFGCAQPGCGVVFKLDTTGKETVLHSFTNAPDGAFPYGGLVMDKAGNLYGTTSSGGSSGYGTVFEVDTTGKETLLYSFSGGDGWGLSPGRLSERQGGQPLRHHLQRRFRVRNRLRSCI